MKRGTGLIMTRKGVQTVKDCWYFTHISICPGCGDDNKWKVRRYSKKPNNPEDRISETYRTDCYCIH